MKNQRLAENEFPNQVTGEVPVSVFMLAYQHADYVRQAVESVLSQKTDFPFEICLGEDASSDGTREICVELAEKHADKIRLFLRSRDDVVLIDGRPTGRYNANRTREACRGKYVAICECDDFWIDECKLQKQFDFMESHPEIPICATRGIERTVGDKQVDRIVPTSFQPFYGQDWFLRGRTGMITASVFYRVDAIDQKLLHDIEILTVDWAMMLGATQGNRRCAMLSDITAVYRKHGRGVWTGIDAVSKLQSRRRTLQQYFKHAPDELKSQVEEQIELMNLSIRGGASRSNGKFAELAFLLRQPWTRLGRQYLLKRFRARKNRIKRSP